MTGYILLSTLLWMRVNVYVNAMHESFDYTLECQRTKTVATTETVRSLAGWLCRF